MRKKLLIALSAALFSSAASAIPVSGTREQQRQSDGGLPVDRDSRIDDEHDGMDVDRHGYGYDHGLLTYGYRYGRGFRAEDRDRDYPERMVRDERGTLDYDRDYPYEYVYGRGEQRSVGRNR